MLEEPIPVSKSIGRRHRVLPQALLLMLAIAVAGCASRPGSRAPVEDRAGTVRAPAPTVEPGAAPAPSAAASTPEMPPAPTAMTLPGAENAGKPGFFTVRPGDTLIRIGLETGQNWRDIQRWNGLDNGNTLEVGQVLRIVPPGTDATVAAARPVAPAKVDAKPLDARPPSATATPPTPGSPAPAAPVATTPAVPPAAPSSTGGTPSMIATPPSNDAATPAATAGSAARGGDEDINWLWPSGGNVATGFDEGRSKGLIIVGKAGDPVFAAADGRVVYAGSGLRGYGNLVIVKHNATYLTAYAHNQALLVKEDQPVRRGQKIAEMGATDAERVQLHFEIRKQGKPIDPARLLPPR